MCGEIVWRLWGREIWEARRTRRGGLEIVEDSSLNEQLPSLGLWILFT